MHLQDVETLHDIRSFSKVRKPLRRQEGGAGFSFWCSHDDGSGVEVLAFGMNEVLRASHDVERALQASVLGSEFVSLFWRPACVLLLLSVQATGEASG